MQSDMGGMEPLRSYEEWEDEPPPEEPPTEPKPEEEPEPRFRIELVFKGVDEVPSAAVVAAIEAIERAASEHCREQYFRAKDETIKKGSPLENVDAKSIYALDDAIRASEGKLFLIQGSRKGSVLIYGAIITCLYLLRYTVGVSAIEGYKRSRANDRLANFFRDCFDYDVRELADRCGKSLSERFGVLSVDVKKRQIGPVIVISMVLTDLVEEGKGPKH